MLIVLFSSSLQFINGIFHTLFLVLQEAPGCWGWIQPHPGAGLGSAALGKCTGMFSASLAQWWECLARSFFLFVEGLHPEKAFQRDVLDSMPVFLIGEENSFTFCHQAVAAAVPRVTPSVSGDNPDPGWKVPTSPKSNWISVSSCKDPKLKALNLWLPGKLLVKWVPWDYKLQDWGGLFGVLKMPYPTYLKFFLYQVTFW